MSKENLQTANPEPERLTKKYLINHFLLFRVGGSLALMGSAVLIGLIERSSGRTYEIIGIIAAITFINFPYQLFYLWKAFKQYREQIKPDI